MQRHPDIAATWPDNYDEEKYIFQDYKSHTYVKLQLQVEKSKYYKPGNEYVLAYRPEVTKDARHCVFVKSKEDPVYSCINSWGNVESNPQVPIEQTGNQLWSVNCEISEASKDDYDRDQAQKTDSKKNFNQRQKFEFQNDDNAVIMSTVGTIHRNVEQGARIQGGFQGEHPALSKVPDADISVKDSKGISFMSHMGTIVDHKPTIKNERNGNEGEDDDPKMHKQVGAINN
jgi:hypothetical protein